MDLADQITKVCRIAEERGYRRGVEETAQMFIFDAVEACEAVKPFAKAAKSAIGNRSDDQHWLGFSIREWRRLAAIKNEVVNG